MDVSSAERFRRLHEPGSPVVLGNVWDAIGARMSEEVGFAAVATTSETVALSLGFADSEGAPADEMLAAAARVCRSVSVPCTVDAEGGYGLEPGELIARLVSMGAAGFNIEDTDHSRDVLADPQVHAARIAALRDAADAAGVPLVINARVDVFLRSAGKPQRDLLDEAIARGERYLAAGADCVYPIMAADEAVLGKLAERLKRINVLLRAGVPSMKRLAELGIARISVGPAIGRRYIGWLQQELDELADRSE